MAKGKTQANVVVIKDNKPVVTITKTVELVVVNGDLVPDPKETNPGVNSITQ